MTAAALRSLRVASASDLPLAVPGVWHGDALGAGTLRTQPSGHAPLDAQLPGGGWPQGALCEVLQPRPGLLEWALVLPALAQATARRPGAAVVLVAPPCEPFGPALQARGLAARQLCMVRPADPLAALWAAEQALRCRDVLAVLAWLPQAQPAALRRLQLAGAQLQQLLWVFRGVGAAPQASPAPLRLRLQLPEDSAGRGAAKGAGAVPGMQVHILKRRGPPLEQAIDLPAGPAVLAQVLAAQARRRAAQQAEAAAWMAARQAAGTGTGAGTGSSAGAAGLPAAVAAALQGIAPPGPQEVRHALARTALAVVR